MQPVLCLLGPTASGKTGLAVELCQRGGFEIVSVDSALVYKKMNIGTAKPDSAVLSVAPHALIDLVEPWESYSVARFLTDVAREIDRISETGRIPVLTGGTMLYYNALWNGLSVLPEADTATRDRLQQQADSVGWQEMHDRLALVDAQSAAKIHPNDPQRLLRALEVYELSGVPLSELQNHRTSINHYDFFSVGLFPSDRALLHSRIAQRFTEMLAQGFTQEVEALMALPQMHPGLSSMRCVGYRQMWNHLTGECTHKQMTEQAVAATRQLAKRQITWMRRMENLQLMDVPSTIDDLLENESYRQWIGQHI